MIGFDTFFQDLGDNGLDCWLTPFRAKLAAQASAAIMRHGDFPRWLDLLKRLPAITASSVDLSSDEVRIGKDGDCGLAERERIATLLRGLMPWRKGPYLIHGVRIDSEWRSNLKWDRLKDEIQPLTGRIVLDAGCGNGYHCWRMLGAGARMVVGIDPSPLFFMQFRAIRHFAGNYAVHLLPFGLEHLPLSMEAFDTVFSMGVLYHRRSPFDHLFQLRDALRPGGELVLETLVIEGEKDRVLVPDKRYAKMRNVWFIPSCPTLEGWLNKNGFRHVRLIDVNTTGTEEQRKTEWMRYESLSDFLDPQDPGFTVEGHPAPRRAVFLARK